MQKGSVSSRITKLKEFLAVACCWKFSGPFSFILLLMRGVLALNSGLIIRQLLHDPMNLVICSLKFLALKDIHSGKKVLGNV